MSRLSEQALQNAKDNLLDMSFTVRCTDKEAWLERAIANLEADNNRPLNHPLDWTPILVGRPEDWYGSDETGKPVVDAYGNLCPKDEIWVEARRDANGAQPDCACIGGSAAGIIFSFNKDYENGCPGAYKSKTDLFHAIRGEKPINPSEGNDETLQAGHDFEDAVAVVGLRRINEEYLNPKGWYGTLVNDQNMYMCGVRDENGNLAYPHAIADMDRIIWVRDMKTDETIGYYGEECKTTRYGNTRKKEWIISAENPGGYPLHYGTQTHHYEAVCNISGFFIVVQDHSMLKSDFVVRFVPRDIEAEKRMLNREEQFIQDSLAGKRPAEEEINLDKYMKTFGEYHKVYADSNTPETGFTMPPESIDYLNEYFKLNEEIKLAKEVVSGYEAELKKIVSKFLQYFEEGEREYGMVYEDPSNKTGNVYFIRAEHGTTRTSYDVKRLYAENRPLFEKVLNACNVTIKKGALTADEANDLLDYANVSVPTSKVSLNVASAEEIKAKKAKAANKN